VRALLCQCKKGWFNGFGLKSFTCLTLAAISIGQLVAAFDFQPKTPPKQQGTDVVRVSDGQTDTIALSELIPTQDAL